MTDPEFSIGVGVVLGEGDGKDVDIVEGDKGTRMLKTNQVKIATAAVELRGSTAFFISPI